MIKFTATLEDKSTLDETTVASVINLPLERVTDLLVQDTDSSIPPVLIKVDPAEGERVHRFSRVALSLTGAETSRVEVFEIKKDGKTLCRLYWHPVNGPILSTQDLYF